MFNKIIQKVPSSYYISSNSRTSIWRKKNNKVNTRNLYFGLGIAFNYDTANKKKKIEYEKIIQEVKNKLSKEEIEYVYNWVNENFNTISKKTNIEINSKGKLFIHLLYILPYIKDNFIEGNLKGFISRILYNCTRSWYTNWCKKQSRISKFKE